jgi:uncharacterized protein
MPANTELPSAVVPPTVAPGTASAQTLPAQTTPAVLITGGSAGIGLALALQFAHHSKLRVILVARRSGALSVAAEVVRQHCGTAALTLALDVTSPAAIAEIEQLLAANRLHLEVLVNNAGIGLAGRFDAHTCAQIDDVIALNIAALTRTTRHFLPDMVARGSGGILNIASLGGMTPGPFQAVYYASKAYVISLTQALAAECRGQNVRIAVIVPGPVETGFHARMGAESAYYRRFFLAPTADFVGRVAYRGFRWGRTTIIPGAGWTALGLVMKFAPHTVVVPVVHWLLRPR